MAKKTKKNIEEYPSGGYLDYQNGYKGFGVGPKYYQDNQYFRTAMPDNIESINQRINSSSFMGDLSNGVNVANQKVNDILGMADQFKGMFGKQGSGKSIYEYEQSSPNNLTKAEGIIPSTLGNEEKLEALGQGTGGNWGKSSMMKFPDGGEVSKNKKKAQQLAREKNLGTNGIDFFQKMMQYTRRSPLSKKIPYVGTMLGMVGSEELEGNDLLGMIPNPYVKALSLAGDLWESYDKESYENFFSGPASYKINYDPLMKRNDTDYKPVLKKFPDGGNIPKMYNGTGRQSNAMFGNSYGGGNNIFNSNSNRYGAGAYTNSVANDWQHTKMYHDTQKFADNKVDWGFMNWAKEPASFAVGNLANSLVGDALGLDDAFNKTFMGRTTGGKLGSGLGKTTTGAIKTIGGVALNNPGMVADGVGDIGQGTVGTYANINAENDIMNYNKEGYISNKRTQRDMDYFNNITDQLGGMYGNVNGFMGKFNLGTLPGFKKAQGGLVEGQPIQAEKFQGQPEQIITPDGTIQSTNAQTSHENMGNNTITDQLPEGSHIQSSRNKLTPEEILSIVQQQNPDQVDIIKKKLESIYKDTHGNKKNKEISPSDITEYAKKKYQTKETPNSFKSSELKKEAKENYANLGIQLNELLKIGNEVSHMAQGGFINKYNNGTPKTGLNSLQAAEMTPEQLRMLQSGNDDSVLPENFDYNNIQISNPEDLRRYMKIFGVDPNVKLPNYKFGDVENTKKRYLELSKQVKDKELINEITNLKGSTSSQLESLKKVADKLQKFHKLNDPALFYDFAKDTKDTRTSIKDIITYGKELTLTPSEISLLSKNSEKGYHQQSPAIQAILNKADKNISNLPQEAQTSILNKRGNDGEAYYRMPEKYQFNFGDITDMNSPNGQAYSEYLKTYYKDAPIQGSFQKDAYGKYTAPTGYVRQKVDDVNEWKSVYNKENPYNKGTYTHDGAGYGNISVMPYMDESLQPKTEEKQIPISKEEVQYNPKGINPVVPQNNQNAFMGLAQKQLQTGLNANNFNLNQMLSQNPIYYMETPDTYIKSRVNEIPVDNTLYNIERTARNTNQFLRDNTSDWSTLAGNTLNNAANMYNQVGDQLSAINEKNVGLYNTTQGLEQGLLENNMTVRNRNLGNMQEMVNKKRVWTGQNEIANADKYNEYYNAINEARQKEDNQKLEMMNIMATSPDAFKGELGQQVANNVLNRTGTYNNQFVDNSLLDFLGGNSMSNLNGSLLNIFKKKKK